MERKFIPAALLGLIFLTGCSDRAIEDAARDKADIEAAKVLPDLPDDCRRHAKTGVVIGDRLDTAVLKINGALGRQVTRTDRCAGWYDDLQAGVAH